MTRINKRTPALSLQGLSVPEAAYRLGIGVRTTWELIRSGELPSLKIRKRRIVRLSDLDRYLADRVKVSQ